MAKNRSSHFKLATVRRQAAEAAGVPADDPFLSFDGPDGNEYRFMHPALLLGEDRQEIMQSDSAAEAVELILGAEQWARWSEAEDNLDRYVLQDVLTGWGFALNEAQGKLQQQGLPRA
jgi:hypothetical protein